MGEYISPCINHPPCLGLVRTPASSEGTSPARSSRSASSRFILHPGQFHTNCPSRLMDHSAGATCSTCQLPRRAIFCIFPPPRDTHRDAYPPRRGLTSSLAWRGRWSKSKRTSHASFLSSRQVVQPGGAMAPAVDVPHHKRSVAQFPESQRREWRVVAGPVIAASNSRRARSGQLLKPKYGTDLACRLELEASQRWRGTTIRSIRVKAADRHTLPQHDDEQ